MVTEEEMKLRALFEGFNYVSPKAKQQTLDQLKDFQGSNLESFPERYIRPGVDVRIAETPRGFYKLAKQRGERDLATHILDTYGPSYIDSPAVNVRGFVTTDLPAVANVLSRDSRDFTGNRAGALSYGKGFTSTPGAVVHELVHNKQELDRRGRRGDEEAATFFENEARLPVLTKHPFTASNPSGVSRLLDSYGASDLDEYRVLPSEGAVSRALRLLGIGR